jgi:hypothetical protein
MCHYRSYVSEDKAKAEAEHQKELAAKRDEVVRAMAEEAKTGKTPVQPSITKEPVPAK